MKTTAFRPIDRFLPLPVDLLIQRGVTHPLRSTRITPLRRYYRAVRPWPAHRYFSPRGSPACAFSLTIANQVLKFPTKARTGVTPPVHRTSPGQ